MVRAEVSGGGQFTYKVEIIGFMCRLEYDRILENIESIKREIKAIGKEYGYVEE